MRFISKFTKIIGILIITTTCISSIIISVVSRDFEKTNWDFFINFATNFESSFYDYRMRKVLENEQNEINKIIDNKINEQEQKSENIVLVAIDDDSLSRIGTYPVPRDNWARLIDNLNSFGAKIIAFDVFFPEKSKSCSDEESADTILANSILNFQTDDKKKVVLPYTITEYHEDKIDELPDELWEFIIDSKSDSENAFLKQKFVNRHNYPLAELAQTMPDLAYIMMREDRDGVFRHYPIVANLEEGMYFPSLGLKAFQTFTNKEVKLHINQHNNGNIQIGDKSFFINHHGETKIRWFGAETKFDEISLQDVLYANEDDQKLKNFFQDKIVFIGSTALGAHDFRNTPVDPKTPGVYAHMNMLYMLLNDFYYQDLYESMKLSVYLLFGSLLILLIIMYFGNPILDTLCLLGLIMSIYLIDYAYFLPDGYELRLFFVFLNLFFTYMWITGINFSQSNKEKKQIKGAFSRYVAPSIVNDMLDHPDKLKVGGERRDITCMFSDVRDFTSISEQLSANDLATALNKYMGVMTDIVFETNGTLDKYIGDAIVAFWGAPIDIGDHAAYAVDAAVKMLEALPAINEEFIKKGFPEFKIGLGLNSGECNVGNMGSDQIFAYTALGDNMNLGARLESSCKYYGAQILISEYTYERLDPNKYKTRLIDNVQVKGKTKPVKVYEVLYSYHHLMQDEESLEAFSSAYKLFVNKEFEKAINEFDKVLNKHPDDKSSIRLKENCEYFINNPPESGVDHTINIRMDK